MLKKFLCFGAIPLIAGIFALLFTNAAGPYWLAPNNDPAYYYFFNSLYLLDGLPLYPTTHPGLTLDVLGALTFKLFHPFLSHQGLFLAVIQKPEFYLHVTHGIMVFMYVVSLGLLGWYAYKKSRDIYFALLVQSGSLLVLAVPSNGGDIVLPVMAHVKPETLLVTIVNLLMVGLLKLYWNKDARSGLPLALYLGCVCALGVFTKYTFILSLALVLFLLRGFAGRCWFILGFMAVGYIFYNVETDPYHRILIWVKDLVFKSGSTGEMSDKFIEPAAYVPALMGLMAQNLFLFLTAGLALIVGIIKRERFLFFISGCVLFQFLMVAKHPSPHYMVPVVGLCGLILAILYDKFRNIVPPKLVGALIVIFMAVTMGWLIHYVQKLSEKNQTMVRYSQSINAAYPGYAICPFYQSSSQVFTLACYTNDMNTYYNKLLKQLYPDYYYYDINARDFKDFLSRWVPLSEIESGHKGVLLYGNDMPETIFRPYTIVHKIDSTPQGEALYEVVAQQSPHAGEFLQYSLMLYAQGQYEGALQYAVYAKQLGLPDDISGYLNQVAVKLKVVSHDSISIIMVAMLRIVAFVFPFALWVFLMRDFVFGLVPVNMDTNTIYGVTKFYFNNVLNGVVPLWEPFVSLGRPFYAIAICNLFNPATLLVPLLKLAGMNYANAFVVYMMVYFLIGCIGFYFLVREILKDSCRAYLAYLGLMFSSFGASMFTQFTFLELTMPAIWFFFFLLRFARQQTQGYFLGLTFASMLLISSYLPFYFITVFLCFLFVFVLLYFKEAQKFCIDFYQFLSKHWRLSLLGVIGIFLAAAPLLAYKVLDASGDVVAPGRHCQYSSAQECYDRTMGRQGGMSYDEITRSGTLGERLDMQYLFGNLDKITYGSDSLLFLPVWVYIMLGLSLFLRLNRLTVLLSGMALFIGLIALGNAAGLLGFLYRHIFFFAYFRNLFFLGAFLVPIVILLGLYQFQMFLSIKLQDISDKKLIILGVIVLHALMFWFLKHYEGVPKVSYVTLGLSVAALSVYFSEIFRFSPKVWTGFFAVLLVLQPAWILKAYALNANEFASVLPSMHVTPVFSWVRPLKPAVSSSRIYQFVPYEDFWYDMSMTDAPPKVGYPQSATRWTFDLSEHTPANVLADYARYKIILYDGLNSMGKPVAGPGEGLAVNYFDVNTLRLNADFPKPQIVVYNDSYTASWKAYLDGQPVELLRANGAFKGIKVPAAGKHTIEFSYHPPGGSWVYIVATSVLFIFLLVTVFMLYLRL